jgi:hypothetical protein
MHRALTGRPWRTSVPSRPTLRLRAKSSVRAGSRVTLRWTASDAGAVTSWRVSLDGHVVATVPAGSAGVSRRASRAGRHTWRVRGIAADGTSIVTARRAFRVIRRSKRAS